MLIYENKKSGELLTEKQYMEMLKSEYQDSSKDITFKEYLENDLDFEGYKYNHLINLDSVLIQYKDTKNLQIKTLSQYDTSVLIDFVEQIMDIPQSYLVETNNLVANIKTLLDINPLQQ